MRSGGHPPKKTKSLDSLFCAETKRGDAAPEDKNELFGPRKPKGTAFYLHFGWRVGVQSVNP